MFRSFATQKRNRYWINEGLLKVQIDGEIYSIAQPILQIIDAYVDVKRVAFEGFIQDCERMAALGDSDPDAVEAFIRELVRPAADARVFEIVSFAILKPFYKKHGDVLGVVPGRN